MKEDLVLRQERCGFRYGRDSFLLADFFSPPENGGSAVLDVGAGVGTVAILLKRKFPDLDLTGIEIDKKSHELSKENSLASALPDINFLCADFLLAPDIFAPASFCAIVANPPYRKCGNSRVSPDRRRGVARHEVAMTLEDLVRISSELLAPDGSLTISMIYERYNEYLSLLKKYNFAQTALKKIYGKDRTAPIVFLSAGKLGIHDGSVREKSLYMIDRNGEETQGYRSIREMQW